MTVTPALRVLCPLAGVLLALLLTAPAAQAQLREAPWGPNQYNAHDLEVRRDALPDTLATEDIEVVVEASDEYCKPRFTKLIGISVPIPVAPGVEFFCRQLATYADSHAGALPVRLSRQTWQQRDVGAHVAQLDVPAQRRHVLLSRWRIYDAETNPYGLVPRMRWTVEEALWDRTEQRLLWHALRTIYTDDVYEKGRIWGMQLHLKRYFAYTLPSMLGQRGQTRAHAPVPGSQWVAPADIAGWRSDTQGAIAFVNNHFTSGLRDFRRSKVFDLRPADQPYVAPPIKKDWWASEAWMKDEHPPIPGITPPMDPFTHALLAVPPGRYVIDPYDRERGKPLELDVQAGAVVVVEFRRALVGADGPVLADDKTWQKALAQGPHAFLADSRPLPPNRRVEAWFTSP
ncbi:hypothetical protein NYO99_06235 [Pelomonas sp. UHG3]|uniref:Uncharacterized protein n=1 Tax=Roseateles hydrophilus TaxID=2975054 RepID=A0ACC6C835_9BURK|nr:hypothetical protein [Pelomonas sp. UHG3]MCY4744567.1 hypothetical protein [Pelomonas sp. UHG3]